MTARLRQLVTALMRCGHPRRRRGVGCARLVACRRSSAVVISTAAGDCKACHTQDGGQPFAGGRAVPTPFGTIYATNITPDDDTGIGKWTDDDFWNAMHRRHRPRGEAPVSGVSVSLVHEARPRRRARHQEISGHADAGAQRDEGARPAVAVERARFRRRRGTRCSSSRAFTSGTARSPRNGTAARTSSKVSGTAEHAIRRRTSSAPRNKDDRLPRRFRRRMVCDEPASGCSRGPRRLERPTTSSST